MLRGNGLFRWNTFNYLLLLAIAMNVPFLLRVRDLSSRLLQALLVVFAVGLVWSRITETGWNRSSRRSPLSGS